MLSGAFSLTGQDISAPALVNHAEEDTLFSIVPVDERETFLVDAVGQEVFNGIPLFMHYENIIFSIAEKIVPSYGGGHWEFAKTVNGISFMFFTQETITINTMFMDNELELPGILAGISINAIACIILLEKYGNAMTEKRHDLLVDRYHNLLEEGRKIADTLGVGNSWFRHTD